MRRADDRPRSFGSRQTGPSERRHQRSFFPPFLLAFFPCFFPFFLPSFFSSMFLTFFLSLTLTIFLRTILRPQQDDVKGPTGGTVSDTSPPCPDAQSRRAWSKGMHNGGLQARMGEIEVSRWDSSSACSAARINQRPRVCPRGWRKRKRSKMPRASIGRRR